MEAPLVGVESSFDRDVAHCLAVDAECGGDNLDGDAGKVLILNLLALLRTWGCRSLVTVP